MKLIICCLGLHDWKILNDAEYLNAHFENTGVPIKRKCRICTKCGKLQEQEVHCLGLNPPKYIRDWLNVSKIDEDAHGKARIVVDGAGALMVYNEKNNICYSLIPGSPLGPIERQGNVTNLGEYAIGYSRSL